MNPATIPGAVDFARMIWPVGTDAFFRETWEKRPLVLSRNDPEHYRGLLTTIDVDNLIYFGRPKFVGVERSQYVYQPSVLRGVPQERLLPASAPSLLDLRKLYAQGKTILIHSLQLRIPAVATMCRNFEVALHHPVNINMYLTPQGAQGFGPHYDDHDVFIIQLDGFKHWRVYGATRDLPLKLDDAIVPPQQLIGPAQEARLEAGDLLYIPRGYAHEAFTSEQASLHLTVGVEVFRWADLLTSAVVSMSRRDVRFRHAVPVGWMNSATPPQSMRERFQELLHRLANMARLEDALADLGEHFVGQLPALPDGRFADPLEPNYVDLDTVLEKRVGVICSVIDEGESVSLHFPGNIVREPIRFGPALRFLTAATGRFTARTLPDEIGDDAKVTLVRRLVREGLLTAVASQEA